MIDRFSRRVATVGLLGAVAAIVARPTPGDAAVTQTYCGNVVCRTNPGQCKPGCVCCVYANGNSRCRPPGACLPTDTQEVLCPDGFEVDPSTNTCAAV
jgi:hypothetical protein